MKKILALLLALVLCFGLVACGPKAPAADETIKIGFVNYDPTAEQYLVSAAFVEVTIQANIKTSSFDYTDLPFPKKG